MLSQIISLFSSITSILDPLIAYLVIYFFPQSQAVLTSEAHDSQLAGSLLTFLCELILFAVLTGELCEEKLDFCAQDLNPCQHDSKCILMPKGFK